MQLLRVMVVMLDRQQDTATSAHTVLAGTEESQTMEGLPKFTEGKVNSHWKVTMLSGVVDDRFELISRNEIGMPTHNWSLH
jgi:hypothetical protein